MPKLIISSTTWWITINKRVIKDMIRIIGLSSFVRTKVVLSIMAIALLSIGCDDTTDTLGSSLTNSVDKFDVLTDTFDVKTSSYAVGAVV